MSDETSETEAASEVNAVVHADVNNRTNSVLYEQVKQLYEEIKLIDESKSTILIAELDKFREETSFKKKLLFYEYEEDVKRIIDDYNQELITVENEMIKSKQELKMNLLNEYNEKLKYYYNENTDVDITTECINPPSMRKKRSYSGSYTSGSERKRKTLQNQIEISLSDESIKEDINQLKSFIPTLNWQKNSLFNNYEKRNDEIAQRNIKIEDGKLYIDEKCFDRACHVYLKCEQFDLNDGIISSISSNEVIVKKISNNNRYRIPIGQIQNGSFIFKKRPSNQRGNMHGQVTLNNIFKNTQT